MGGERIEFYSKTNPSHTLFAGDTTKTWTQKVVLQLLADKMLNKED